LQRQGGGRKGCKGKGGTIFSRGLTHLKNSFLVSLPSKTLRIRNRTSNFQVLADTVCVCVCGGGRHAHAWMDGCARTHARTHARSLSLSLSPPPPPSLPLLPPLVIHRLGSSLFQLLIHTLNATPFVCNKVHTCFWSLAPLIALMCYQFPRQWPFLPFIKQTCISLAPYIPRIQNYFHTLQSHFLYSILNYFLAQDSIQNIKFEVFTAERVIMVWFAGL
jgi:hypothetical protein